MTYEQMGSGNLDYFLCHYGVSKLSFRGPKKRRNRGYCAVIGGSETFGKFVEEPYPVLLETLSGREIVNLGCMFAGAQVFSDDPTVLEICRNAEVTIIQLTGAQNMTNRFYVVHPRRNDRFLRATPLLISIYPDMDFTNVHFTGHLLSILEETSNRRFQIIRKDLQKEWVEKMEMTLARIGGRVILLWLSDHIPGVDSFNGTLFDDPMLLERHMIDQLIGESVELVEIVATPDEVSAGHERMIFTPWEETAARRMLGPIAHQEAARQLTSRLEVI